MSFRKPTRNTFANNIPDPEGQFVRLQLSASADSSIFSSPWEETAGRVYLQNTGSDVGIGTETPDGNLEIRGGSGGSSVLILSRSIGGAGRISMNAGANDPKFVFENTKGSGGGDVWSIGIDNTNSDFIIASGSAFGVAGKDIIHINQDGDVGIGLAPTQKFDVIGDEASDYVVRFFNDGSDVNRFGIRIQAGHDTAATAGTTNYILAEAGAGDDTGVIRTVDGVFALADLSDGEVKDHIHPTKVSGSEIVDSIEVVEFCYSGSDYVHPVGFVAQQVESIFPYMITETGPDATYPEKPFRKMTMKSHLVPVLVKAIQELMVRIKDLEKKIKKKKDA